MSQKMKKNTSFMSFEMLEEDTFEYNKETNKGSATYRESTTITFENVELKEDNKGPAKKCLHKLDSNYVLEQAYSKVKSAGSSTAVIGIMQPDNRL